MAEVETRADIDPLNLLPFNVGEIYGTLIAGNGFKPFDGVQQDAARSALQQYAAVPPDLL